MVNFVNNNKECTLHTEQTALVDNSENHKNDIYYFCSCSIILFNSQW